MVYFISDVHLRQDRPERAERLARFVSKLDADDRLIVVGDLCDFWMASRELKSGGRMCCGLTSLANFTRGGGELTILPGNHDAWIGSFYEETLGARFQTKPWCSVVHGRRIHAIHGHRIQRTWDWKKLLETRAFFGFYSSMPNVVAALLSRRLDRVNDGTRAYRNKRMLQVYREYAAAHCESADLFVFGHIHGRVDEPIKTSQLIVLGDWYRQMSYLSVSQREIQFRTDL